MSWRRRPVRINRRKWERVRLQVFDRDGWRCVDCGKAGRLECDHVIPLHRDPRQDPYDLAGLATRCVGCHIAKTRAENERHDPARERWRALVARFE